MRREFNWLWGAFAVSTVGTWLAFDAFPLIAILVLHAGPTAVSGLAAAGLAVGALLAVPLGPWVEFRRKRPVMVGMDLIRFAAVLSVPAAYALGLLSYLQLLVVSVLVAAADIAFTAASGAYLKGLLRGDQLLAANARFEATTWTATMLGPPLGGAAIGLLGPVTTTLADAVSYLLSAAGLGAIGDHEPAPPVTVRRRADLVQGWRFIWSHGSLRRLYFNTMLFNGLVMAGSPVIAVLMLGRLGFAPWQYGLAFGLPCLGGLLGARLARPLVAKYGTYRVLRGSGIARAFWPLGLAFVQPGLPGLALVIAVQFGLVLSCGVFGPVNATYKLEQAPADLVARMLAAWSVSTKASIAALTALWGVLAGALGPDGPRWALAAAGALLLTTPFLLRRETEPTEHPVTLAT